VLAYVLPQRRTLSPAWLFGLVAAGAVAVPTLCAAGAPELPLLWGLCLALGLTIPACREITSRAMARIAHTIATYSYSIYLTHMFALAFALGLVPGRSVPLTLAAFLAAQFALARVCYRWIERPGIEAGVRVAARWTPARPRSLAP
jgi:peptidoglycan/LPS O-acetylase OafA/YrhL